MSKSGHRNLALLKTTAATSRVLNLSLLHEQRSAEPDHLARPLFKSKALNTAIILKHRLRTNEMHGMSGLRANATKVVMPFDARNLRIGGNAFFVGQTGQEAMLREGAGISPEDLTRDLHTLSLIDQLPSLDPFLLREHLRRNGVNAADSYFDISTADMDRMRTFVASEIRQLVSMAFNTSGMVGDPAGRLSDALLSTQLDERLEPLRVTLRLEGDAFREGVFCWKGFLYYKWMRDEMKADLERVAKEIGAITVIGPRDAPTMAFIGQAQEKIRKDLGVEFKRVAASIADYDAVFDELVTKSRANAFRDFLLAAPARFLELGERVGNISHIASFWRFRFPNNKRLTMPIEEALDMLQDFESSLGRDPVAA